MSEWRKWCSAHDDLVVKGSSIDVKLPDGRGHRIQVDIDDESVKLSGRVASRGALSRLESPELWVWSRNRVVPFVSFRFERYDALVGELVTPSVGLGPDEFVDHVRVVAAECDRLEVLLTGEDVE